jgi:hypothetical protein
MAKVEKDAILIAKIKIDNVAERPGSTTSSSSAYVTAMVITSPIELTASKPKR